MGSAADRWLPGGRAAAERRLAALVRANRVTIAVVFPLVGGTLLLASHAGLLGPLDFNPFLLLLGTAVMRLPLVGGLAPLVDRRAGVGLAALAAYTYLIEFVGVSTGLPYGEFSYGVDLGPMVAGVPAALPIFFFPMALNGYLLVVLFEGGRWGAVRRALAAVGAVVAVDLVLDPAAVALGFWRYAAGGAYYGVPASNYAGWVLSAAVAVAVLEAAFDAGAVAARLRNCEFMLDDLVSFVLLWGVVNARFGQWVPVALAAGLAVALVRADRFDFAL
jgi:putative membrane protein